MVQDIEQYRVVQEKIDKVRILIKKTNDSVDEMRIRNFLLGNLLKGFPNIMFSDKGESIFRIEFVNSITLTVRGKLSVVSSKVRERI